MKKLNTTNPLFITNSSMTNLINEVEAIEDSKVEISWNSFGGSVWGGNLFADFLQNTKKITTARVTGIAASMGGVLLAFFDNVIGAKQADIMLHSVSSSIGELAKKTNTELYSVLKSKINEEKFKLITGFELKDIMFLEGENRKNIWITGQQAFDIGLFDELIDITPDEKSNKNALLNDFSLAAFNYELPEHLKINKKEDSTNINQNSNKMDVTELKAKHPGVYAEVFDSGKKAGLDAEKDRVNTWLVFNDLDAKKVKIGIESGVAMTKPEELGFMRASQNALLQASLEDASVEDIAADKKTGKVKNKPTREEVAVEAAFDEFGIEEKEDK